MVSGFFAAAAGGVLIGTAAALLLLLQGRIAGISGILGGALREPSDALRWLFLAGLAGTGLLLGWVTPQAFSHAAPSSPVTLVVAGVLVGVGTSLGRGCTSGHGVCGIGRGSPRSLAATLTFMAVGALTVYLARHLVGGAS